MIEKELLELLVCPENHTPLHLADDLLLADLNRAIADGNVKNKAGEPVKEPLEAGLLREDGTVLYPIVDDIPVMLVDEAIVMGSGEIGQRLRSET